MIVSIRKDFFYQPTTNYDFCYKLPAVSSCTFLLWAHGFTFIKEHLHYTLPSLPTNPSSSAYITSPTPATTGPY